MQKVGGDGAGKPKKIIIDTDPGIDDAMAILFAFQSPELDVVGLTTIFGNVRTPTATSNALHLCELAGRPDVPVAQGELRTLMGLEKVRVADFVHGADGLGNTHPPPPKGAAVRQSAPEFLVEMAKKHPKEITVVALGPLTNLAKAITLDASFVDNVAQIVVLGGAFFANGNVNPAAEANIFGDPEAADAVFTCGADVLAVGINITHQVVLTAKDLDDIRDSDGPYGKYIHACSQFYLEYHREAYQFDAVYLHDPTTMVAALDAAQDLFTFKEGAVRVQLDGIMRGITLMNNTDKLWVFETPWSHKPLVKVAVTVDAPRVSALVKERLMQATS
eukprot:jgi/Mesen1/4101/ME000216S03359